MEIDKYEALLENAKDFNNLRNGGIWRIVEELVEAVKDLLEENSFLDADKGSLPSVEGLMGDKKGTTCNLVEDWKSNCTWQSCHHMAKGQCRPKVMIEVDTLKTEYREGFVVGWKAAIEPGGIPRDQRGYDDE